jgi:tetratricopeptide (TPR) repeat protein
MFPLQNVMADRYLWLTSLAFGLLLGAAWGPYTRVDGLRLRHVFSGSWGAKAIVAAWLVAFTLGTAERAALFGDPVALFADASRKSSGPRAPYQLGYALALRGETAAAIDAYREALARECDGCAAQRNAANNLALLLVERGEPQLAEPVLRRSAERFPDDPKTLFNLVKVLTRVGKQEEARHWFELGRARFPTYLPTSQLGARGEDSSASH